METKVVPNKTYSRERTSSLMKELLHPEVSVAGAAAVVIEALRDQLLSAAPTMRHAVMMIMRKMSSVVALFRAQVIFCCGC